MEIQFKEAQPLLNKVLVDYYNLKHPEKISYIDKIILWANHEIGKDFSLVEDEKGIKLIDPHSSDPLYFFKNPEINMD